MPYVTLVKSSNGKFDVELPSLISNVSQVGLVDFSFDSKKIDYLKESNDDLRAHFEYDPSLDDLTKYNNISMAQIDLFLKVERYKTNNAARSNLSIENEFVYSCLKYDLTGEEKPWAEFLMYQFRGTKTIHKEKITMSVFEKPAASLFDFQMEIQYTKWDNTLSQAERDPNGVWFDKFSSRILISGRTLLIYIFPDVPQIILRCNNAANRILGLKDYDGNVKQESNTIWQYEFNKLTALSLNLPDVTVLELKKIMMESKFGKKLPYKVGEVYTGPTFDIEPDLNKFIKKIIVYYIDLKNRLKLGNYPQLKLKSRVGKLVVQEDIHESIKLYLPERICKFFGYSGKYIIFTKGVYSLPIFRGCVAMSIRSSNLIASTTNFYHELATVSLTKRNRYTPKHVNYLPLAINIIHNIEVHITDFEGRVLNLDDSQPIITLHFK